MASNGTRRWKHVHVTRNGAVVRNQESISKRQKKRTFWLRRVEQITILQRPVSAMTCIIRRHLNAYNTILLFLFEQCRAHVVYAHSHTPVTTPAHNQPLAHSELIARNLSVVFTHRRLRMHGTRRHRDAGYTRRIIYTGTENMPSPPPRLPSPAKITIIIFQN